MKKSANKNLIISIVGIVLVVIIFLVLIVLKSPTTQNYAKSGGYNTTGTNPAPAVVASEVGSVSQSVLNTIGIGTANQGPQPIKAPLLTQNNKPEIFYEGAEYCPYCATERWAMAVALSRFGSFSNLKVTHSSSSDVYPDTQTLSFYQSSYTSNYITFNPVEVYTNIPQSGGYTQLQTPSAAENKLFNKYDSTPYVPSSSAGSIPFIDFANQYLIVGATYSPTVLQGKSATQIAASLSDAKSPIAKGADGAANTMVAAICKLTNNQPSNVCDSTIKNLESTL